MGKKSYIWGNHRIERLAILLLCIIVTLCVGFVFLFEYEPDHNNLGALGSVCLDVISIGVLIILLVSYLIDITEINRTTRLFLGLLLGTMWGVFFDFLTWSLDGSLSYDNCTFAFIVASLCAGSILAGFFTFYLSSYLYDMYDIKASYMSARICLICNLGAFVMTLVLAILRKAFVIENGHYKTGSLYDAVTAIPLLTLIYMAAFIIHYRKIVGIHDIIAVIGYITIMICGVLIESTYTIGTSYVSLTLADVFIFVMLQNKFIGRVKKQKEELAEKISSQYETLESMAGIYSYVNYVDLKEKTARRFDKKDSRYEKLYISNGCHTNLNTRLYEDMEDELKEKFWLFTDLSTLPERMKGEKIIAAEFCHKKDGWFSAQYIRIGDAIDAPITKVIYTIRNIDEQKKNVDKWIKQSNTDELTGFYNRHAYEDQIALLKKSKITSNFVYVSIDVNSLKLVNDMYGHDAGDELIKGAADCMRQCFGSYGKIYRTGGDEFVALIFADDTALEDIKADILELTENWRGELNESLTMACGYVTGREAENMTIHDISVLADKRMYENKAKYYHMKGIDRRGQRDAHVALCALYTKILKVNITEDSYQIVNMLEEERDSKKGFADKFSEWVNQFGESNMVFADDLEDFYSKTNREYISGFFKRNKTSLKVFYRRLYGEEYKRVMLEIIPANDYTDENQNLFLYVKNIE